MTIPHEFLYVPSLKESVFLPISRSSFTESRRALYPERTYSQSFLTKIQQGSEETSHSDFNQDTCPLEQAGIFSIVYDYLLFKSKYSLYF